MSKKNVIKSLLDRLQEKEGQKAVMEATESKKAKVDAERVRDALEEELDVNPAYLDDLDDDEYMDLMDALPDRDRSLLMGDDAAVQMADEDLEMLMGLDPDVAANNLELFPGAKEITDYLMGLDAKGLKEFKDNVSPENEDLYQTALDRLDNLGPREMKMYGGRMEKMHGGMLVPPERMRYSRGKLVKLFLKGDSEKKK